MGTGAELRRALLEFGTGPLLAEMPRRTLADKGIAGPTAAHVIEELHTPLNLAYTTFTTGTTAFQTPVGVTWQELPDRAAAGVRALERCGVPRGAELLVTYPPLVNVFSRQALEEYGSKARFILRPSRDALLAELVHTLADRGAGVVGLQRRTKSLEEIFLSLTETDGEVA